LFRLEAADWLFFSRIELTAAIAAIWMEATVNRFSYQKGCATSLQRAAFCGVYRNGCLEEVLDISGAHRVTGAVEPGCGQ
jgi:hypothetical protein